MLTFNNNNSSSTRNLFSSSSRGSTHDKSTQTPESIERETRRHKLRSLKINFNNVPTPSLNFKLGFLNQRKRNNLSANAVATEQKATKVKLTSPHMEGTLVVALMNLIQFAPRSRSQVLGLVFFTFVLCWSPFFILNILFAACPKCQVPDHITNVSSSIDNAITGWKSFFRFPFPDFSFPRFVCGWDTCHPPSIQSFIQFLIRLFELHSSAYWNVNATSKWTETSRSPQSNTIIPELNFRSGRPSRYRSVTDGRGAISLCVPSALPLAISLQGAPLLTPSSVQTPLSDFRSNYQINDEDC